MTSPAADGPRGMLGALAQVRPPVREPRFWVVQAAVLTLAGVHDFVLDKLHAHYLAGVPAPTTSALLLIPVVYAALNFGVRGAVGTSLWATVLIVPHWLISPQLPDSRIHFWIEVGYLVVLNVVAIVVGVRVEGERLARRRAEHALEVAENAEARYYRLFEDQPAPVMIADAAGAVTEANTAATALFGRDTVGLRVDELLGVGIATLLDGRPRCLDVRDRDGRTLRLVPTTHRVTTAGNAELAQVVLTDVTEQHRREEEERLFAGRLLKVQEDERRALARELHDDPLQNLTYLSRALDDLGHRAETPPELAGQLVDASAVAEDAAVALRKVIHGLRPPVLDDLGLVAALRQLAQEVRRRTGLAVELRVRGHEVRLPPGLELAAYRIAQEALNNVVRHARASRVEVCVCFDRELELTITDDGLGWSEPERGDGAKASGLGLIGMRERVNMAGGTLSVTQRSGHGTRVRAVVPVPSVAVSPESSSARR
ncbi:MULTISPECIES: ATP-binding protein [unclassified Nocardioides]|uniref:sensor histidine kinase n=1 Tax=unclassified Nocardioides TaxID=2615069 RepID=UPI0000570669|nr:MULTISPECIES: ATP-binding protein [unclassified Nocardioides]ABL82444.1 ATP-binding region, ATPase domain protein [Nocardioides sp. JS614]